MVTHSQQFTVSWSRKWYGTGYEKGSRASRDLSRHWKLKFILLLPWHLMVPQFQLVFEETNLNGFYFQRMLYTDLAPIAW